MSPFNLVLTLGSVFAIGVGQILFKLAAQSAGRGSGSAWDLLNPWLFAALAVYAVATALWVWVLKSAPLHIAYPFMGFAFIVVPVLAAAFLGEPLDWRVLAGAALVGGGVAVASWR
jgi:drug/metabolite transporter (DMT)-like permease